jgi:hypothetical protein
MRNRAIIIFLALFSCFVLRAQTSMNYTEVNERSLILYNEGKWHELLVYGKQAINQRQDFVALRLRMGYAAWMEENYVEALKHYEAVLQKDAYQETAHDFIRHCRIKLNQAELAEHEQPFINVASREKFHMKSFGITKAAVESGIKFTNFIGRENASYNRLEIGLRLGWNFHLTQSAVLYNQTISEPKLIYVNNNISIPINQKEYYAKLTANINRHWQAKAVYHYLYTPFNNFTYNNQAAMIGIRHNGYKLNVQADALFANLNDTSSQQYNFSLEYLPLGNNKIYSYTTASLRVRNSENNFNFKQVLGCRIMKQAWLEGHATLGGFQNYFENDALYLYNAIDPTKWKAGAGVYVLLGNHLLLQAGFVFEQRVLFLTNNTFNQQSITGGLSWKF